MKDKHVLDPLYGYISPTSSELEIIDSESFQRLRRIQQLGLSSLIYPGANHSRFEHSLGVMHLAGRFAKSLELSDQLCSELRLAGLLHDVGHTPYSHALEHIFYSDEYTHEDRSCDLIDEFAASGVFEDDVRVDGIKSAIQGTSDIQLVAGTIDVDRMDYLYRDAYHVGLEHGLIDVDTLIQFGQVRDGKIVFPVKTIQAIEELLIARYNMNRSVYQHPTSRVSESMLQTATKLHLQDSTDTSEELARYDDFQLHAALLSGPEESATVYQSLINRDLYTIAWEQTAESLSDRFPCLTDPYASNDDLTTEMYETIRDIVVDASDICEYEFIIDIRSPSSRMDPVTLINEQNELVSLSERSPIAQSVIEKPESEWNVAVYTPAEYKEKIFSSITSEI